MSAIEQAMVSFINSKCPIPQGMTNPDDIINYLLQNNKISQEQYNNARAQTQSMKQAGQMPTPEAVASFLFRR